jgi:proline iminopeptidase
VGEGHPVFVLHGGPSFDHNYLLPDMDRLAGTLRVIYYAQRGRGLSADGVEPGDVTMESEVEDLDAIRRSLGLDAVALIGHSWGGLLAMYYAISYPEHVSHLILMHSAPASAGGWSNLMDVFERHRPPRDREVLDRVEASESFQRGELDAEAEYNRAHFRMTLPQTELLDELVGRIRINFTPERVLKAEQIADRLHEQTSEVSDFDLLPALGRLDIPTLVITAEHDFIPVDIATEIADAIPRSRLVVFDGCGHFSYMERPDDVFESVTAFIGQSTD